jgi:hypothetical protein
MAVPAVGATMTVPAADVGYIESEGPRHEGRILVRFGTPEGVEAGTVELAVLELRASATADSGVSCVVVDAFPLTTGWNGAMVSWDGDWGTPGGDFDRTEHAVWMAQPGADSLLRFDVTGMVKGWMSETMANNGIILAVSPGWPGALGACEAQGAGPGGPTLRVYCSPHAEVDR